MILNRLLLSLTISFSCAASLAQTRGGSVSNADTTKNPGNTYAVVVGISKYTYIKPLLYADEDAKLFKGFLKSPAGGNVKEDNIYMLLNEEAKAANFWVKGMAWLREKHLKAGDKLYIYLAGHGDAIDKDEYFFLTYDCNPSGDKNNYIVTGNIQLYNLKTRIKELHDQGIQVFLIIDACRSNELPGGEKGQHDLINGIVQKESGEIMMLSTNAGNVSWEDSRIGGGHGLFTYYLIDGLSGMADKNHDNIISLYELNSYVSDKVEQDAQRLFHADQIPIFCCDVQYPVASVDSNYLNAWVINRNILNAAQKSTVQLMAKVNINRAVATDNIDTNLTALYNKFNSAIKEDKYLGDSSADFFYRQMTEKFPDSKIAFDAKYTLASELINFSQSKINYYLDEKNDAYIQHVLNAKADANQSSTSEKNKIARVIRSSFGENAQYLERTMELVKDDPDLIKQVSPKFYFLKARSYFSGNVYGLNRQSAKNIAYLALHLDTNASYVYKTLSDLYEDQGKVDSALHFAKITFEKAPNWSPAWNSAANAYKDAGLPDLAEKYYNKCITINSLDPISVYQLGEFYYNNKKDRTKALTYIKKSIDIDSNFYAAYNMAGIYYRDTLELDSAEKYFKKAIQKNPDDPKQYNNLADVYIKKDVLGKAKECLINGTQKIPWSAEAFFNLANFYYRSGETELAEEHFLNTIQKDSNYCEAYIKLSNLYLDQQKDNLALGYIKKYIQKNEKLTSGKDTGYVQGTMISALVDSVKNHEADKTYLQNKIKDFIQRQILIDLVVNNPDINVDIKLIPVVDGKLDSSKLFSNNTDYVFKNGDRFVLRVNNRSKKSVYVNILDLQPDGLINAILPNKNHRIYPEDLLIPAGATYLFINYIISLSPPYGKEVFKIFASADIMDMEDIVTYKDESSRGTITPFERLIKNSYSTAGTENKFITDVNGSTFNVFFDIVPKD